MMTIEYFSVMPSMMTVSLLFQRSLIILFAYYIYCLIYNVFFHPLRKIPGPHICAMSRLPYSWNILTGRLAVKQHILHEKYGPVVRTAPDEVSFIDSRAWDIIYGKKNEQHHEFPKDYETWDSTVNSFTKTLFLASNEDHPRMRKALSPAFSERMLRDNEPFLQKLIDNFLNGIRESSQSGKGDSMTAFRKPVDLNAWFSWLAFDLAAEFVLGENFHCLDSAQHRGWLEKLSRTWLAISFVRSFKSLGNMRGVFTALVPPRLLQSYVDQLALVGRAAVRRLDMVSSQPTLISVAKSSRANPKSNTSPQTSLSDAEILSNAELVVTAGTDTTATALSATVYLLCINPEPMRKVVKEIRAFHSEDKVIAGSASSLPYLSACIHEALRIYDPVPEGLPRYCPGVGQDICGYWIPGGTKCQVSPHAANHSTTHFKDASSFVPERWLHSDPEASALYAGDQKAAFRPFSTGPRDCIGQNFALRNIKMTLCRLLYNYDMIYAGEDNWLDQRAYLLWRRRSMFVHLTPVRR